MFSDFQRQVNEGWKKKRHDIAPVRMRKKNLCPKCGKNGYSVKMDYKGNRRERHNYTKYNVDYYWCPRCGYVDKQLLRIEGKGTKSPVNAGRVYGSY